MYDVLFLRKKKRTRFRKCFEVYVWSVVSSVVVAGKGILAMHVVVHTTMSIDRPGISISAIGRSIHAHLDNGFHLLDARRSNAFDNTHSQHSPVRNYEKIPSTSRKKKSNKQRQHKPRKK